ARWRRPSTSSAGTKRSTSVPPWGSTSLDMTEGSWPGDGKAQPDEDHGKDGAQGSLRNDMGDPRAEKDARHGAGEHGRGEEDVDSSRLKVPERGEGGQDERMHEVGAH